MKRSLRRQKGWWIAEIYDKKVEAWKEEKKLA